MRPLLLALALSCTGCAGLTTDWVLQMRYSTPEDRPAPVKPEATPENKKL